jgi:hypothetical protein
MNSGLQIGRTVDNEAPLALLSQARCAEICRQLRIGGISIQIVGSRKTDVTFDLEHEPFGVTPGAADIDIEVLWVDDLAPTQGRTVFDSGTTWRLYRRENAFQFDFLALGRPYKRLFVDNRFHRATLEMSARHFKAFPHLADPLAYPLDELLMVHRLTQEKAIELHGSGIVRANGVANLFVGHSGAGKSTTTRLWTDTEDVEVLSDDRIIVRRDEDHSGMETPCGAAGLGDGVGILRLRDRSASPTGHSAQDDKLGKWIPASAQDDKLGKRIPASAQDDKTKSAHGDGSSDPADKKHKMRMYGTPWHGEAMFASPNSAPLTRIFVLEHGHGNVITRLSPSQAVAELFARSFVPFHRHEYVDSALVFLEELVDSVPVYRYSFEPDQRAVDKIRHFND